MSQVPIAFRHFYNYIYISNNSHVIFIRDFMMVINLNKEQYQKPFLYFLSIVNDVFSFI